ncbi:hypothetical protein [Moritella sp. F3]|uniref:hypothetical protein n=1 Tax=Moritella sp. F3 TaxID=2718882 RepID=UPI0018E16F5B|nr:hypothetical protein [Moritella sp. F3]GIC77113.1 hypothetical protein FMO001_18400 [Moritella sp. F1]GIC82232.1 hypothetical protein FMO003_25130 [Moritella sp. F3]
MNTNDKTKLLQRLLSSSPTSEMAAAVEQGSFFAVATPTLCHPSLTIGSTEVDSISLPDLYETKKLAIEELNELTAGSEADSESEEIEEDYFVVSVKWDGGPIITLYENDQEIYEGDWKIVSGLE